MNTTNQLPEPELGYIQTDKSNQPAFSARQMREAMERATQAEVTDEQRERVHDAVAAAIGDALDCTRVWSAWNVGTMSEDDFAPVAEDADRVAEIADAAILALRPSTAPNLSCKSVQARLAAQWGYVRPAAVPMTPDDISDACDEVQARSILSFMKGVRAAEAHHGITAQAKKEGA